MGSSGKMPSKVAFLFKNDSSLLKPIKGIKIPSFSDRARL